MKHFQITSADDGTNVPQDDGFLVQRPFVFSITNGTTINAVIQKKTSFGNWVTIPDPDSRTTLSGADAFTVTVGEATRVRISVTTATGTWDVESSYFDLPQY